jgi:hypothetical protein
MDITEVAAKEIPKQFGKVSHLSNQHSFHMNDTTIIILQYLEN